jgi:hypothetical protein
VATGGGEDLGVEAPRSDRGEAGMCSVMRFAELSVLVLRTTASRIKARESEGPSESQRRFARETS